MRTLVLTVTCVVLNGVGFVTYKAVSAASDVTEPSFQLAPLVIVPKTPVPHRPRAVVVEAPPPVAAAPVDDPPPVESPPVVTQPKPVVRRAVVNRQASKPVEPPAETHVTTPDPPVKTEAPAKAEDPLLKMEANPYKRKN